MLIQRMSLSPEQCGSCGAAGNHPLFYGSVEPKYSVAQYPICDIRTQCEFLSTLPITYQTWPRAAVIGNAGSLIIFRVGSRDAELLAPEFRTMETGALADQEPFTAWLKRGTGHHRIFIEAKLYESAGTREAILRQSRERFGRPRNVIEAASRAFS